MKYKCPCCGYYTFSEPLGDTYDICPVCYWEDDEWQMSHPDEAGGANKVSLNQAKQNYKEFGACEQTMKAHVRPAEYKDTICADISELFTEKGRLNYPGLSIEAHLEVVCGDYFVQGNPDGLEYVYWPISDDNIHRALYDQSYIVAIICERKSFAFVCDRIYDKFCEDTKDYNFDYIRISSLLEENLMCEHSEQLPEEYKNIVWINDDFMNDKTIDFDYEAFELIDSGVDYLNPKHFSIYEFSRRVSERC